MFSSHSGHKLKELWDSCVHCVTARTSLDMNGTGTHAYSFIGTVLLHRAIKDRNITNCMTVKWLNVPLKTNSCTPRGVVVGGWVVCVTQMFCMCIHSVWGWNDAIKRPSCQRGMLPCDIVACQMSSPAFPTPRKQCSPLWQVFSVVRHNVPMPTLQS